MGKRKPCGSPVWCPAPSPLLKRGDGNSSLSGPAPAPLWPQGFWRQSHGLTLKIMFGLTQKLYNKARKTRQYCRGSAAVSQSKPDTRRPAKTVKVDIVWASGFCGNSGRPLYTPQTNSTPTRNLLVAHRIQRAAAPMVGTPVRTLTYPAAQAASTTCGRVSRAQTG